MASWASTDSERVTSPRNDDHGEGPWRAQEARVAPEPQTAEQRTVEEDRRRVTQRRGAAALLGTLFLLAAHWLGSGTKYGGWVTLVLLVLTVGLSVSRRGMSALASPIRGIVLVWLAISVSSVVLVSLDSFSGENIVLLAIVWGILFVLWLGDRSLSRLVGAGRT